MPSDFDRCFTTAQAESCARAFGWPQKPQATSGEGNPEGNVLGFWPGDTYVNTDDNTYWYFNGDPNTTNGWFQIVAGSTGLFLTSGNPEGVLTASPPAIAVDTTNRIMYLKLTGNGNTGWIELLAF